MVTVHYTTTDKITAWRVPDALSRHPLLGGPAADIQITADHADVIITGWIANAHLLTVTDRLAKGIAGRRTVLVQLDTPCMHQ